MRTCVIPLILSLLLLASTVDADSEPEVPADLRYDEDAMSNETGRFRLKVRGVKEAEVSRLWSNKRDDVDCSRPRSTGSGGRNPYGFGFSRQGSPERALYEWHLCFKIGDAVYRGWRGFDPGPGATLSLSCQLDASIPPSDTYACRLDDIDFNRDNYREYAHGCRSDLDGCRGFESEDDYEAWIELAGLTEKDRSEIAFAIINHEVANRTSYLRSNPMVYYVQIDGSDPSATFLDRLASSPVKFHAMSDFAPGKGMKLSIGPFKPRKDGSFDVSYLYYCGPLCASSHSARLKRKGEGWRVLSTKMNWISKRAPPNKALQLTGHSAFQSIHGTIWHSTRRSEPTGQRAGS